ncbi:MAG: UDP-2,3-diacylglucosamine diphosphatase LpxI, partial [Methyloceanibacter sp.]|nr:UDP-2,3-diacylglucosamine diphosphatase LpxI [Methyloceanibacter sp.]
MPIHVAEAAVAQGRPVHIVALKGSASEAVKAFPHTWVNIGQIGRILSAFKQNGCKELVIIGSVRRPNFGELRVDWGTVVNLNGLLKLRTAGGDSSLLGRITTFFEAKGMHVSGAHEIAPDLLAARGPLGRLKPNQQTDADIEIGRKAVAALGPLDVGQAVVVARGHIIAVEAAEGTDAVVERCKDLKKWSLGRGSPRVGVLVKCANPGQDRRIDLPSIGPETVRRVAEARLTGIAVAA